MLKLQSYSGHTSLQSWIGNTIYIFGHVVLRENISKKLHSDESIILVVTFIG